MCIAGIRPDGILFQDVIQPQTNRENYDTEILEQAENETTRNAQFTIQIILLSTPPKTSSMYAK